MNPLRMPLALSAAFAPLAALANPVFPGADPHVAVFEGKYWGYPSHSTNPEHQFRSLDFVAYSSPDLVNWKESDPIFKIEDIPWLRDHRTSESFLWAPGIAEKDGKYYLYYSIGPQNPNPSIIGVAVADKPDGPFKDSGKPLIIGDREFEAIDPMVFQNKDGTAYLYAGGSAGAKLRVWKLKPNMVELGGEMKVDTPPQFTEGAFMHEIRGTYYLSYSHGGWNNPNYSVHYATSKSPLGPWDYRGSILTSDGSHKGPGHHSFFRHPKTGQWYIAYHYWPTAKNEPPLTGVRQCAIRPVEFAGDGTIIPVAPSDEGPSPAPLN